MSYRSISPEGHGPRWPRRLVAVGCLVMACLAAPLASSAIAAPAWDIKARWGDTNLPPGGTALFEMRVRNLGDTASSGVVTLTQQLPSGVTRIPPKPGDPPIGGDNDRAILGLEGSPWSCAGTTTVTCTFEKSIPPPDSDLGTAGYVEPLFTDGEGALNRLFIRVAVSPAASGTGTNVVTVAGGGAVSPATDVDTIAFDPAPAPFGFPPGTFRADLFDAEYPAGVPVSQAGTHPFEMRVDFDVNLSKVEVPAEELVPPRDPETESGFMGMTPSADLKTIETILPRGVVGNPEATPKCPFVDFNRDATLPGGADFIRTGCPPETQVGTMIVQSDFIGSVGNFQQDFLARVPIYNLVPPKGVPADFGFRVSAYRGHIYPSLDPTRSYAIKSLTAYISSALRVRETQVTFWGVPADPAHDALRADPTATPLQAFGTPSNAPIRPLLSMPMDCNGSDTFKQRAESWQDQGDWTQFEETDPPVDVGGCDDPRIRFEPKVALQPTSRAAGGPTGLTVNLEVPQRDQTVQDAKELYAENGDVNGIDTPPLKKAVVTLPEGMTLSTSAAQGLGGCTPDQIGLGTNDPVRCPESSRYGALTIHTPILPADEPMQGDIYIAQQGKNPFGSFLAMYFVIHDADRGLLVKLPGRIDLDPVTGQIRTTFDDLPQFPVSDMELSLKGGVRAGLVNPATCGNKTIEATFYSWHDPGTPIASNSSYEITQKPDGSPCVNNLGDRPFKPELSAGTVSNAAGSYSPFVFRLTRSDDDQEFSQLGTTLPPGLLANISKVTECPEANIAQAEAKGRTGSAEALFPSCPASSQLGTTEVGSGVGQVITYIPGKAYLAGPYKGEPLSMVVITPILAGPYDLGTIAVRSAIHVNAEVAQASVQTDPFPQIYEGIPVRIRDVRVKVDRPETTINPTSCDPMAVTAHVTGTGGNLASTADDTAVDLSSRFQAANCASLGFKPKLSFRLKGGTKRGDFPALTAVLKGRPGDANIARTSVTLPRSSFVAQSHIRTVCTRVQFNADQCPAGSIYGKAKAISPLFDETLEGPVYLRSNGGERLLPDLVVSLNGKIDVVLAGFVDSVNERVRNTFDVVPDAPVTSFVLQMQGAGKGLLENSRNLCKAPSRADVRLTAQNGKTHNTRPKVAIKCGKGRKAKRGKKR